MDQLILSHIMRAKSIARKLANNNNNINNGNNDKDCDNNDKKKILNAFLAARGKFLKYCFKTIWIVYLLPGLF